MSKLIHVVHIQKYNLRHMPEQIHLTGTLEELAPKIAGYNCKEEFNSVQELLTYMRSTDTSRDFNLIYSHEAA